MIPYLQFHRYPFLEELFVFILYFMFHTFTSTGAAIFKRNVSPWFPRRCRIRKVPLRKMVWCEPVKGPVRKKIYNSALRKRSGYIFQFYISNYKCFISNKKLLAQTQYATINWQFLTKFFFGESGILLFASNTMLLQSVKFGVNKCMLLISINYVR